uniref:Lipoma HMGIC fusion partner homolog n=1 Tax=Saccoglossus kowalevskii TaxID=10224 RepID=A0ABM0MCG2_SACKO
MTASLTKWGIVWTLVSLIGTTLSCAGYYLPYWLNGSYQNHTGVPGNIQTLMVLECGRYTTFSDIPTLSWKACTIIIGIGCGLAILVSLTALLSCCVRDLITRKAGRVAGGLQFLA